MKHIASFLLYLVIMVVLLSSFTFSFEQGTHYGATVFVAALLGYLIYTIFLSNQKVRGFELVADEYRKHGTVYDNHLNEINLIPRRATDGSAGHDFVTPVDFTLAPCQKILIWTDVKAYMPLNEVLKVFVRSSIGTKLQIVLANGTGIIDATYYSNEENDGNIGICLINTDNQEHSFKAGDRIAQGIFQPYLIADNDKPLQSKRKSGFGSSGK